MPGLTVDSFDFYSALSGGNGPLQTAAHVQGIGDGGAYSGWVNRTIEVPEPATMSLLALGGMALLRRKK